MSLRDELVKLAKANPDGIREHLVPILKQAATEKFWKLLGELKQSADGTLSLRVGLRSGGSAAMLWRKFQLAYTQRKLQVSFDDTGLIISIPGRGEPPALEEEMPLF